MAILKTDITGLVLAGGRGSRMGGVDKGLQLYEGQPLARHALMRLVPQVGSAAINANRNFEVYRSMGFPVWPDGVQDYPGPLAGILSGLENCATTYLATVPCDAPNYPLDLVAKLTLSMAAVGGQLATAYTKNGDQLFPQPVFSVMHVSLHRSLQDFIASGERKAGFWLRTQRTVQVVFEDDAAFLNVNTLTDLKQAQVRGD